MDSKIKIENDPHIDIKSSPLNSTMTSVLNIKEIKAEDRFIYMCLADNQGDNAVASNSTILIRVVGELIHLFSILAMVLLIILGLFRSTDKYAALWPFLGICAEVIILCTVIFIYEKRRGNKKFDEDGDQPNS